MKLFLLKRILFLTVVFTIALSLFVASGQRQPAEPHRSGSRPPVPSSAEKDEEEPEAIIEAELDEDDGFVEDDEFFEEEFDDEDEFDEVEYDEADKVSSTNKVSTRKVASNSPRISLKLKNMDILEVFNILSQQGKINIIAGTNVRGRVTLFLDDVDIWDAFRIILEINNLAYMQQGDIVKVLTEREYEILFGTKFYDKTTVKVYPVLHTKASILKTTAEALKSRIGKVLLEENTNSIIIIDTPKAVEKILSALKALDVPVETVVFDLLYALPGTVEEKLKTLITTRGIIHTDLKTSKIIITEVKSNMELLMRIVKEIDQPPVVSTTVFPLQYSKHDSIGEKIEKELTKDLGTMSIDERTNKVAISDTPEATSRIRKLIEEFDAQSKEVIIECQMLQVRLSDEFKFGINWEQIITELQNRHLNFNISSAFSQLTDNALPDTAPFDYRSREHPGGRIVASGFLEGGKDGRGNPYQAILEIIRETGDVDMLSSPRITVIDNQTAEIQVGTNEAYVTSSETLNSSTSTTAEAVNFIRVGILLKVTPRINDNGFINMEIEPEVSAVQRFLTTASGNQIPIVRTSNAKTFLMVRDGVTIILGGFIEKEIRDEVSKVPVLGSIPILGLLFKRVRKVTQNAELVIFLTPYIITGDRTTPEIDKINDKLLQPIKKQRKENEIMRDLKDLVQS